MASMSVEQMREAILKTYRGDQWKWRVKKMSDNQVLAVYNSMRERKILRG